MYNLANNGKPPASKERKLGINGKRNKKIAGTCCLIVNIVKDYDIATITSFTVVTVTKS